jgi:hypothetical protein
MQLFLKERVFQEGAFYVYNKQNILEKHLRISNTPVRSRVASF